MRSDKTFEDALKEVELPPRVFLYTLDQIAFILNINLSTLRLSYIYFQGLSTGVKSRHFMVARDVSPPDSSKPEWRVTETELVRWMKLKGFRFTHGGRVLD